MIHVTPSPVIRYNYYVEKFNLPHGDQGEAGPLPAGHRIHTVIERSYTGSGVILEVLVEVPVLSLRDNIEVRDRPSTNDHPGR